MPDEYVLLNNYPNPFNPSTRIRFGIPEASLVTFTIFDGMGNEVIRNTNRYEYGGYYELLWNGKNSNGNSVSSGVYFYRIEAKSVTNQNIGFSKTAKMLLLK
ncbi:MAG TPA: FlgD immunoglobulin-like domain containing protein [Ignavibacteriaceae bacterium]|nr:FlgD immunoglobulin-like domain containing protein [Ignavibacteriaceae bacterium]